MRKLLLCFVGILTICGTGLSLDRQPGTDYRARREALAKKAGAVIVLLAPLEKMDAVYEFRQEDNFYYLSGVAVPGAGLLIAPAVEAKGETPARTYTEILFLPPRNLRLENLPEGRWAPMTPMRRNRPDSIESKRLAISR